MISKCFLLMVVAVVPLVCDDKRNNSCSECPKIPKLYQELGCVGKMDENGCCFDRFVL